MAKYLILWRKNATAPWPLDPAELLTLYKMMWDAMDLQMKSGEVKDSGYFLDGDSGYVLAEGDAKNTLRAAAAFSPFYEVEVLEEVVSDQVAIEVFTEDLKDKIAFAEAMKQ